MAAGARRRQRDTEPPGRRGVIAGLLLALGSAALINLGFLLQHRGLGAATSTGMAVALRSAVRKPHLAERPGAGLDGFAAQIVAVAIAPLSLVQAFAAGGLALSVPLAAGLLPPPDHPPAARRRAA